MMVSYARKKKKKKLLKLHLKFDKKQFSDIVTVDETGYTFWSHREKLVTKFGPRYLPNDLVSPDGQ